MTAHWTITEGKLILHRQVELPVEPYERRYLLAMLLSDLDRLGRDDLWDLGVFYVEHRLPGRRPLKADTCGWAIILYGAPEDRRMLFHPDRAGWVTPDGLSAPYEAGKRLLGLTPLAAHHAFHNGRKKAHVLYDLEQGT